jgi:hypothetical protein
VSYKENIVTTRYGLADLQKLKPIDFQWIESKSADTGFTAQDVQTVIPEAVTVGLNGLLGLNYAEITAVLVASVQQLAAQFTAYVTAHP